MKFFKIFFDFLLSPTDYPDGNAMVQLDHENSIQCVVHDKTPDSEQRKINIVVRPPYTVGKVIADIKTQYRYDKFDLILQPNSGTDLVGYVFMLLLPFTLLIYRLMVNSCAKGLLE